VLLVYSYLIGGAADNGRRFGHHCHRRTSPISIIEVNRNKLISPLIYGIKQNPSMAATEKVCARPPTPQAAWVHQIHTA
jgi:hypothetical protein